jgi:COMPASS component SWD1
MNLALIDPFQLAQDSPDALTNDLRKLEIPRRKISTHVFPDSGHATTLRFNRKGDYLASGRADGKVVIWYVHYTEGRS